MTCDPEARDGAERGPTVLCFVVRESLAPCLVAWIWDPAGMLTLDQVLGFDPAALILIVTWGPRPGGRVGRGVAIASLVIRSRVFLLVVQCCSGLGFE